MTRFRTVYIYPYSGWPDIPWSTGRDQSGPYPSEVHDLDAAARSARRVSEGLSHLLREAGIDSRRGSYLIALNRCSDDGEMIVETSLRHARSGFIGRLEVPKGFRNFLPQQRAVALGDALHELLTPLADAEGWRHALEKAFSLARSKGFTCEWQSPWKSSRDKKSLVRVDVAIHDDGYGRWRIDVADSEGSIVRSTERMFGWTWLENYFRMAKTMRFVAPRVLSVGMESMFLHGVTSVDLDTALTLDSVGDAEPRVGTVILSYTGEPGHASPAMRVVSID